MHIQVILFQQINTLYSKYCRSHVGENRIISSQHLEENDGHVPQSAEDEQKAQVVGFENGDFKQDHQEDTQHLQS